MSTTERFDTALLEIERCGADLVTARFKRPDGYEFTAGQWLRLTLTTPEGEQARTFTHASAPGDPWIEVMTRLSASPFKRALADLAPGGVARYSGPGGRFILPDTAQRVAFLVGGVGITPVRSMLRDAYQRGRTFRDAVVLYGNRDESCVPYRDEIESMAGSGVRVVHVFEHSEGGAGETGFIRAELVRRHVTPDEDRLFIVSGPPAMVDAMVAVLDEVNVPEHRRMIERFGAST